jgi:RNA polymerase sigma-70 factor (ECF subfamily)
VFARVFSAIGRFDRESSGATFRGWLWRIARNQANDYFRTRRPLQIDDHSLALIPADRDSTEMRHEEHEMLRRVLDIIRGDFHPKTFEVFCRCTFDGHDTEQVAAEFEMKKSAVREAKRRVMNRLREECQLLWQKSWITWSSDFPSRRGR